MKEKNSIIINNHEFLISESKINKGSIIACLVDGKDCMQFKDINDFKKHYKELLYLNR